MSSLCCLGSFRDHTSLTRSGSFRPVAAGGLQLDVQRGDAEGLDLLGDVLRGQHGGVGGRLVPVGLHLHASGHAAQRLAA